MTKATDEARQERRAKILKAAGEVFFESGFAGACIDRIIDRVGGSKRTIYEEFGSKEGLFGELLKENVQQTLHDLSPGELGGHDLRSTLTSFGRRILELQMSARGTALYRVVVSEGLRFPELAQVFWDNGPGLLRQKLAEALEEYRRRGELCIRDPQTAADLFLGMIRYNQHLAIVLGLRALPDEAERERVLKQVVDVFLTGIAKTGTGTA